MNSSFASGRLRWSAMLLALGCVACSGSSSVEPTKTAANLAEKYPACPSSNPKMQRVCALAAESSDRAIDAWRALRSETALSIDDSCAIATALANSERPAEAISVLVCADHDHPAWRPDPRIANLAEMIHTRTKTPRRSELLRGFDY